MSFFFRSMSEIYKAKFTIKTFEVYTQFSATDTLVPPPEKYPDYAFSVEKGDFIQNISSNLSKSFIVFSLFRHYHFPLLTDFSPFSGFFILLFPALLFPIPFL